MSRFRIVQHTVRCAHVRERAGAVEPGQSTNLRLAVKQYIPLTNERPSDGDVTIIGAHAHTFPKEVYEPLWDDLHASLEARGKRIRAIWIADQYQQGASGVLNEGILGNDPSWLDHGRDLLFLINQHQEQMPPPIIGVGHSMGSMQLAHLSTMHPRLLHALVLIDPVLQRKPNPSRVYARSSTYRRDVWPSRSEAVEQFRTNKVYKRWDARALDTLIEYSLRDLPTEAHPESPDSDGQGPAVTLRTTKAQELFTLLRPTFPQPTRPQQDGQMQQEMWPDDIDGDYPFYRDEPPKVFRALPGLKPSVLYIFGKTSEFSSPEERKAKMEATGTGVGGSGGSAAGRVKELVLNCGHHVPMEAAAQCAAESASFIDAELARWQQETDDFQAKWYASSRRERLAIDDAWREQIDKHHPKPKPKTPSNGRSKM